jgi:hypothetical protein
MIDNLEQDLDQDLGGLPILKKSSESTSEDLGGLPILKKKATPVVSSGIPSRLPSEPNFLQQGQKVASGEIFTDISKSVPKGTGKPEAVEGKWSNVVQNVFANIEKTGTDIASGLVNMAKDYQQATNPYIPRIPSSEIVKSETPIPWQVDPLANVIRGLHGNQERMNLVIQQNPLPNTFWGKAVSSVASFAPDIIATAALPEAKLAQGAGFLAKTGNLLFNNFTKYMTAKEGIVDYGKAREEGKNVGQASVELLKGAGKGAVTGMEMALLGAGSNLATKSIMAKAEAAGLTGLKGMATKELVNLATDVAAFGLVSPYSHAALEGRWATAEEIANGIGIATLFRLKGATENVYSNAKLNKALEETQAMKQGIAISNFVDATPESIVKVYNSKGSADELHLKALEAAKKAKETTDLQKKKQLVAEAITYTKASNVKQVADMVINNKDGFIDFKASDLPESAKNEFLQKAEEINKLLNPFEKAKTDLDNKIKESEDLFSQLSQQAQESQDPNEKAQLEAQAREAKDSAEKFRTELAEVNFNQNRPDANAGKAPVVEGEVAPTGVKVTEEGGIGVVGEVEIKNEGKADAPTKESVTERLNINNPFYKKVEDALVKLGLIEKYNPETGAGDVVGGYAQPTSDGGFSVGKMLFSKDGSISYFDGDVKVSFDKNGNVISENTKEAKQEAFRLEIEGKKESIASLEKTRDSESFKYKEVTETDILGNKKKVKRLKTEQELKESADKINAAIDKAKAELSNLEQSTKETPKAGVKPSEAKTVEQLRAEEQSELDSKIPNAEQYRIDGKVDRTKLTNEADKKSYDEVWEKYDKLISPLLEKPTEKKVTVELLSSQEPPQKEGETIVTLSGKTEAERLASIEQRKKDTKVSDKVVSDNEIIQAAESYFKKSGNYKNSAEGRAELNNLRIKARENGLTIDTERNAVTKPNKAGRPRKVLYNNKADGEAVVEPNAKTLRDRDIETQKVYEELTDSGVFLDVEAESGKRMSATQIEAAIKDINEGIPSKRANKYLDALEKGIAEDAIPLYDKGMGGFAPKLADIRAKLGVEKEVIGEPMDEVALNKFLDEESKLTPEEEQDLLDNVENLLYEYETTEAGPEGKVQSTETGAKEGVPSEAKPSEPTKSERQAEYEKIKSNKKKKDFVRNNLPEEFKPLADELTNAQMSEIVDSNFDLKTIKDIQDAVQKQSAAEVLQPKQEGDGGTGGERKRVEQGKQGDELTGEGKAKTAEKAQPKGTEEGEVIGITHEQLNEVARELGFPEYEASPETVEQWDNEARENLKDPEYANKLIAKYEKNEIPKPNEQRAMLMILSSAKAKLNANPSPKNLAEFKKIMELSNNVGGRLVGQSLRARQGVKQVEDTLPDFLLMRENDRGYPFTESEIKDQARVFEELQKEKNALKEALQKSEEANAKLIAEMGVNKAKAAARKAAKKTREEYVIERKKSVADAREALKKLRTGEQGLTAVGIPVLRDLKAVSPHVKNYMKSLVEEGVNKLDDIVNDTYAEFKDIVDGMTKKDVLDIFNGEYDESKPRTRNEKAEELRLLQREAALLKELENVRKGIEKEKNPAQKVKKNDRILELEDKIKEVKRLNKERDRVPQEFTEPEFASKTEGELLASKRKMLTKRIEKLQDDIRNKRYLEEKQAPPKLELDRKTQLLKDRVIKMEREIEAERQKDAYRKMSKTEKAFNHFNQITGIRRVMQTAFDLSVTLRQGIRVALNPRKWDVFSKAFANQMKSVFSDKKFNSLMYDIHNSSEYNKMLEDGIKFNELDALKSGEMDGDFQKSFLYGIKIPVARQFISEPLLASQRAADGFLNTARYELYLKYEKQLLKQGITRQSDPEAYKKMADLVMNMTGRGKLISFLESGKANKVVSNTFYGARLMAANINTLNPVKYAKLPPGVRKEVMKDMLSYVTTTAGIMLAASAAGYTVEMDPDKPDFLQIRKGDKVYDITGGIAAYLRTFFRMTSALYSRFGDNKYNQEKKLERAGSSLIKFFRNKLAPNTGYVVNAVLGKNTLNQDFDPYEALEAYPMYADDFAEALKDEGITSLATVLAPNIWGIGYGSYANQANKESLETSLERMLNSDEMNPELIKNHKAGGRAIDEKEFEELTKLIDAKREKEIRSLYNGTSPYNRMLDKGNVVTKKVEDMTEEEVKKIKKSIASEATRLSKEKLFGVEKKTKKEKFEQKMLLREQKKIKKSQESFE